MDRRTFLAGLGLLALSQGIEGCSSQGQQALRIQLLKNSVPAQFPGRFRQYLSQQGVGNISLDLTPMAHLEQTFANLQSWKRLPPASESDGPLIPLPFLGQSRSITVPDLVTLGDAWLGVAVRQGLLQPIDTAQLKQWQTLQPQWQTLVTRDRQGQLSQNGEVWAAPYRWGTTVIAYRQDLLQQEGIQPPTDWGDLWRSDFAGRLSLLDQPREVIGLVLKHLGYSYNLPNLDRVTNLEDTLKALHRQVKLYSSTTYLQPLLLGHTWLAVGWSTDLLPLLQRNSKIAAIVPRSGTALWADLWVRPAVPGQNAAAQPESVNQWIDFFWQPEIAQQLALLEKGASPILTGLERKTLPPALQSNSVLLPSPEVFERSELLEPLTEGMIQQYATLWQSVRQITETAETRSG